MHSIVAEHLRYQYGQIVAVDDISFSVAEGEVLGFLGPNGAGKSTTVKLLTGQITPMSGTATLLGQDITRSTGKVQAQIGVCFELNNLYERMTAEENLVLFAGLYGVKGFDPAPLLDRVGLGDRKKDRVDRYSKGMKQRLMVARALVNKPRILFLDEPTDGLDPVSAESIRNLILEERAKGTTVFLTTHDMLEADKLSDRVAFINQGSIEVLDTPHALKQKYGRRALKVEVETGDGRLETREVVMDGAATSDEMQRLFATERVVTVHSEEATLEDIFIQVTGRGLA